jgi:hypothetical protein
MGYFKKMKLVYACLVEKQGNETLFGYKIKDTWYPAVFAEYKVFEAIKPTLQKMANEQQCNINFVSFSERRHHERITPLIIRPPSLTTLEEAMDEDKKADALTEDTNAPVV